MGVLVRELAALYAAFAAGQPSPLPALPVQYADYAVWQREWLQGDGAGAAARLLAAAARRRAPPRWSCPPTGRVPPCRRYRGATRAGAPARASCREALEALGQREGATLFMVLLAAFQALLSPLHRPGRRRRRLAHRRPQPRGDWRA